MEETIPVLCCTRVLFGKTNWLEGGGVEAVGKVYSPSFPFPLLFALLPTPS